MSSTTFSTLSSLTSNESIFQDALNGNTNRVRNFINRNPTFNLNAYNENDRYKLTLLHIAIETNNLELVVFLLSKGAEYSIKNTYQKSSFDIALVSGNKLILDAILDKMEEEDQKEIKRLKQDNQFYSNRYNEQRKNINSLEDLNNQLTNTNSDLTRKLKRESESLRKEQNRNAFLHKNLESEKKRKREVESENNELKTKNKKLKLAVENLSNSLRK
ncbi:hypothetical protein CPAV1605_384 [seawater metagenome]|uniref:Uncharacterized protein n=1 Tax=seawater metagenome TaxID=1561972 RepID=A0A5E8CJ64_9ZZZZ